MDKLETNIDWKVPIERSVLIDTTIDNASMRLYLILLSYARDKVTAFPSRETLSEDMGCSIRNIDILKKKLKNHGLLDWQSFYNGANKYNVYTLLKYEPIQKKKIKAKEFEPEKKFTKEEKKSSSQTGKKVPTNNKQYKNIIINNPEIEKTLNVFKEKYKNYCLNTDPKYLESKELIQTNWHHNYNYFVTPGDIKNLNAFYEKEGLEGLKKLRTSFSFLDEYLKYNVGYSDFHTSDGKELVPSISLFIKAVIQRNNIYSFACQELRYIMEDIKNDKRHIT